MKIETFQMERTQCLYENEVEFNLSESGVLPLKVADILQGTDPASFLSLALKYPESNGSQELRLNIAAWYGITPQHVLVTNGGSEANFTALWGLLENGGNAAIMIPNYLQAWGLSRAQANRTAPFNLVEQRENGALRWALDVKSLQRAVTKKTRLIVVTNPNNPTGAVLNDEEMAEIIRIARRANAWLVVDEIYRGAEVSGPLSPTFWGRYDKLLITSGLSKAFGLPGLRIGWIVGPPKTIAKLCRYRDYTTLTPTILSDRLARMVMKRREEVLERTRAIIRRNLPEVEAWIHSHDDIFTYIRPQAGAIAFIRYKLPIASTMLFDKLRREYSILITPGAHFGTGKYIRVGFGYELESTLRGLARMDQAFEKLTRTKARSSRRAESPARVP
jgi:aspartate/methionine/tyrosine aminotransferase